MFDQVDVREQSIEMIQVNALSGRVCRSRFITTKTTINIMCKIQASRSSNTFS